MKKKTITQNLAEADRNSRRRNAIKFSKLEESDNGDENYMIPGYKHYGGDKFSAAASNHTAKNWGFGTGVTNNDDEKQHSNRPKKRN